MSNATSALLNLTWAVNEPWNPRTPPMLEVDSVTQYYGGSHILRNVTFTLPTGQLTVLLGRNGVGKTTLLRCLMGVVPIRTGKILWNKKPLERMPPYSRVTNG